MQVLKTVWRKLFHRIDDPGLRPVHIAQALCLIVGLCCFIYLIDADKPWELGLQERLDAGKNLTIEQDMALGFYAASTLTLLISLAAYFLAPWWARPLGPQIAAKLRPVYSDEVPRRTFWILIILAMVLAALLRIPLADKSLWWDETWTLQRVVIGQWDRNEDNPELLEWDARDWQRAFFYYQKPTNHIAFSVSAKFTTHLWQKLTGAEKDEFNEFFFRLPAFLAALVSVMLIGLFVRHLGFTRAGIAAAFLLALHPWHIQYGIDGRAFSFVVLFSMLSVMQLIEAMQTLRWRNWFAFALSQFALLWSFPYALFLSFLLFITAAVTLFWVHRRRDFRIVCLFRLLAANFISGIMICYMIFPLVPQLLKWTDKIHGNSMFTETFFRNLAANLTSGMSWRGGTDQSWFGIATLDDLSPATIYLVFAIVSVLLLAGIAIAIKHQPRLILLHLAYILVTPFALWIAYIDTHYFYTRYVIYALPALIIYCSIAVDRAGALTAARLQPVVSSLLLAALVAAATVLWSPRIGLLLERPVSPNREVAQLMANIAGDDPDSVLTVGFNLGGRKPDAYYKHILYADDLTDLRNYCGKAREKNVPLYLFYGYESFNRSNEPEPFPYLDNPKYFRKLWDFHGIEPDFHYQVFRYSGKAF